MLERLLKSDFDFDALNVDNGFGAKLEAMRMSRLNQIRTRLSAHLGTERPKVIGAVGTNSRVNFFARYLALVDDDRHYDQTIDSNKEFRRVVKVMRKDVMHKVNVQANTKAVKSAVTTIDLNVPGIKINSMNTADLVISVRNPDRSVSTKSITIPTKLDITVTRGTLSKRIEVLGNNGLNSPMTKHLVQFLRQFGMEASAYDAISYCKSWLADLVTMPFADYKTSADAPVGSGKIYGRSQMRWEFMTDHPKGYAARTYDFTLYHVVAKSITTGTNQFHI